MQLDANLGFQVECMAVLIEREGGPSVWKFRISGSRDLQKMPAMREEHRVMLMTCTKSTKSMTKQNRQCTKQEGGGGPFQEFLCCFSPHLQSRGNRSENRPEFVLKPTPLG